MGTNSLTKLDPVNNLKAYGSGCFTNNNEDSAVSILLMNKTKRVVESKLAGSNSTLEDD